MSNRFFARNASNNRHHIMRRHTSRFIKNKKSIHAEVIVAHFAFSVPIALFFAVILTL